jgi:twitching motility two-component system response regulator PilG
VSQETFPQLIQKGVACAKAGDKAQARRLFGQVIEIDPNHEVAWIWLAGIAETPQEAGVYLERVLEINPGNERARAGLKWVQSRLAPVEPTPAPMPPPAAPTKARSAGSEQGEGSSPAPASAAAEKTEAAPLPAPLREHEARGEGVSIPTTLAIAEPVPHQPLLRPAPVELIPGQQPAQRTVSDASVKPASEVQPVRSEAPASAPQSVSSAPPPFAKPAAKPVQRGTILVVDDSPTVRKLVAMTLERDGYRVMLASNGVEALSEIQDHIPGLIFLDISMPRMDGYQLCKLIRGDPATKNIPVILLSGKDGFFDKVKGRLAGSTEYITKPFEPETLLDVVAKYLS